MKQAAVFFRANGEPVRVAFRREDGPIVLHVCAPDWKIPPHVLAGTPYEGETLYGMPPEKSVDTGNTGV